MPACRQACTQMNTDKTKEIEILTFTLSIFLLLSVFICVYLWFQIPVFRRASFPNFDRD